MSDEIVVDGDADDAVAVVDESKVSYDEATEETWNTLLSDESEVRTAVWICSYSFRVLIGEDGNVLPEGQRTVAGETFAATTKRKALDRLVQVISAPGVEDYSGFSLELFDLTVPEQRDQLVRDFFNRDDSTLNITLVELL
jgi:hypothetical protein